ncbi:hypothetical protein RN001_001401 [Aquatica leii]|uniref:limulus clotting factor C n=1 Tax=Aquatica leii TaxID=1421715 RepID=A0AAN7PBJ2_9COLE|nr:hypothetical protein RN001_001401 [Aquatica leii]
MSVISNNCKVFYCIVIGLVTLGLTHTQDDPPPCSQNYECMPIPECKDMDSIDIIYPCDENSICCPTINKSSSNESTITSRISVLPSNCGIVTSTNRIVGGDLAAIGQFPWMALLGYMQKGIPFVQFLCGGSLITKEHVLTAAHCISIDTRLKLEVVRLGEYNLEVGEDCDGTFCTNSTDFSIANIVVHDGFNKTSLENDIAIVKLKQFVEFTEFIQPICLPIIDIGIDYTLTINKKLTVSGWGKTDSANIGGSSRLLYTTVVVWDTRKCNASVPPKTRPIRDSQLCANGVRKQDACKGDSGGPLINSTIVNGDFKYYQVGVVSFATALTCGNVELPTVYTKVEYFLNWIITNIS